MTDVRTMSLREIAKLFGVTGDTIKNWVRRGKFPPPLPLSNYRPIWAREDVDAVIDQRGYYPRTQTVREAAAEVARPKERGVSLRLPRREILPIADGAGGADDR